MKRITALILAVLMIFALCSCQNAEDVTANCSHSYTAATCEEGAKCELCGVAGEQALGHRFSGEKCTRKGCTAKNPEWINWYTSGKVTITKEEIGQIVSMQYKKPRNVIVMIGDGMGAIDIELTEKYNKNKCFDFGLALNQIKHTGFATTYSANSAITDSAASGTALATGVKTNNNYVGMSADGKEITNVSEIARQKGKKVGIVTNDSIVGATPSAFTVHNISRNNSAQLAQSFLDFMPDVLIGQGYSTFSSLDLSQVFYAKEFLKFGPTLNKDPLCEKPFVGFFEEDILADASNTLAYATEIALNRLKNNDKGFFLMVENAATDKAGHAQLINGKVNGVVTFDRAVAVVLKFMKENPDTLLIITSDHETGGVRMPIVGYETLTNELLTTNNHTGVDVRTFAVGYGSEYFSGKTVDNTDIAKFVIDAVKK